MAKHAVNTVLGLLFMINMILIGLGQFTCDPIKYCNASVAGDFVPDPHDCEQYYVCVVTADGSVVPSLTPLHCRCGFYFDQNNRTCMEEKVPQECHNLCPNFCPDRCTAADGSYAADKNDCSIYYLCAANVIPLACTVAPDLYFNGTICQKDPSKCCNSCEPFCVSGGTQIVDSCDCHSFYVCTTRGEPSETSRGTCPSGFSYDEATVSCTPTECSNFCSVDQCAAFKNSKKSLIKYGN